MELCAHSPSGFVWGEWGAAASGQMIDSGSARKRTLCLTFCLWKAQAVIAAWTTRQG